MSGFACSPLCIEPYPDRITCCARRRSAFQLRHEVSGVRLCTLVIEPGIACENIVSLAIDPGIASESIVIIEPGTASKEIIRLSIDPGNACQWSVLFVDQAKSDQAQEYEYEQNK